MTSPWRRLVAIALGVALVATPNVYLVGRSLSTIIEGGIAVDWHHFVEAGRRVHQGGLYDISFDYGYRYSPVLAYAFALLAPMGELTWRALHIIGAIALPTWPMRLLSLISWPFWFDVEAGNVLIFILLAAAWALRGNAVAIVAFGVMAVLMPRPLMLPVLAWLLVMRPEWRVPFVALVVLHSAAVAVTGWGGDWLGVLISSGDEMGSLLNLGPSRFIGVAWIILGLPLAGWLTLRGRLGWASLAVSPYWLPYYLLMPILELSARRHRQATQA